MCLCVRVSVCPRLAVCPCVRGSRVPVGGSARGRRAWAEEPVQGGAAGSGRGDVRGAGVCVYSEFGMEGTIIRLWNQAGLGVLQLVVLQFGVWAVQNEPPAWVFCLMTLLECLWLSSM